MFDYNFSVFIEVIGP